VQSPVIYDAQALVAHYEELRRCVIAGQIRFVRHGLAVLLQNGMAAWMEACSACLPGRDPATRSRASTCQTRLSDERHPALVDLLANLALNRLVEVHA
jgi:hypothetical protein